MNKKTEPLLVALWRTPNQYSCDVGLFDAIGDEAGLTLYRVPVEGSPVLLGVPIKLNLGAVDIGLLEALPEGQAIVGIAVVGGNCFNCEQGAADFLLQNNALHQLKDPGVGAFRGMPSVSNGEVEVETFDGRWESLGIFAHAYGSSITSEWRLKGQEFVEECVQTVGPIDPTPSVSGGDAGRDFQVATTRFLELAQGGQVDVAWPRYRDDLQVISRRSPDQKVGLDKYIETLGADLERSKVEMMRHACHLEGLKFTWDD